MLRASPSRLGLRSLRHDGREPVGWALPAEDVTPRGELYRDEGLFPGPILRLERNSAPGVWRSMADLKKIGLVELDSIDGKSPRWRAVEEPELAYE